MAERLIRESDVIENIEEWLNSVGYATIGKNLSYYAELKGCIEDAPTIEAKPVVHAHWEQIANGFMVCSHCEELVEENRKYSFCPLCGAQMDEVVVEENATTMNNTQKVSVVGVKIPVIPMEDVPKLAKEMEK